MSSDMDAAGNKSSGLWKDLDERSTRSRMVVGSTLGCLSGMAAKKIGKLAVLSIGGGLVMLRIARRSGYVEINRKKIDEKVKEMPGRLSGKTTVEGLIRLAALLGRHGVISVLFVGGFVIGFSFG